MAPLLITAARCKGTIDTPAGDLCRTILANPQTRHAIAALLALSDSKRYQLSTSSAVKAFLESIPPGRALPDIRNIHGAIWATFAVPRTTRITGLQPSVRCRYADSTSRFFVAFFNAPEPPKLIARDVRKRITAPHIPKDPKRWRISRDDICIALAKPSVDPALKALLALAWDTLSRVGELTSMPGVTSAEVPVPNSALTFTKSRDGSQSISVTAWTKNSRDRHRMIITSTHGFHMNPRSVDPFAFMDEYLAGRPPSARLPDAPLWATASGRVITRATFSTFLKSLVPPVAREHLSGHCIRISATCDLHWHEAADTTRLMQLGRWDSPSSVQGYIDKHVTPLLKFDD
jgi:hypothetical protein